MDNSRSRSDGPDPAEVAAEVVMSMLRERGLLASGG